jgi:hypothetical protein
MKGGLDMKRKVVLILSPVLAPLLFLSGVALAGDASAENDIELAKEIAQVEVA